MSCLRAEVLDNLPLFPFKGHLILIACEYCKMHEKTGEFYSEQRKELSLLISPLLLMVKCIKEPQTFKKGITINVLKKLQDLFSGIESEDEIRHFLRTYDAYIADSTNPQKNDELRKLYETISEKSYLQILKVFLCGEKYTLAFRFMLMFLDVNIELTGQAFRNRYHYRMSGDSKNIILDIGFSLDEGFTEYLVYKRAKEPNESLLNKSRYYLEVKFIRRMMEVFGEEETISAAFASNLIAFMYDNCSKLKNRCGFYNLYNFTDNHEWGSAVKLLSEFREALE